MIQAHRWRSHDLTVRAEVGLKLIGWFSPILRLHPEIDFNLPAYYGVSKRSAGVKASKTPLEMLNNDLEAEDSWDADVGLQS